MFEETRPYNDNEIPAAIGRLASHPYFPIVCSYLFPHQEIDYLRTEFSKITTVNEFQDKVMYKLLTATIAKTTNGFEYSGLERLTDEHKCTFIGNHRDIVLDASLLQYALYCSHLDTSEITFGDNLMKGEFVTDFGKINKMFRIVRGGNIKDFYKNSMEVSSYMRYAITQKNQSTWIAQRNGRTKDGFDKTEPGVLKMLAMSSDKDFIENLTELNITPIAISYEYESCDFLKTQELYVSRYQKYVKAPNEDFNSILCGITQPKGQVSMVVTPSITLEELEKCSLFSKTERFSYLAKIIDKRIVSNYKLFKNNYIAYDILQGSSMFAANYTNQEKKDFMEYMKNGLDKIEGDKDELTSIFLGIYANPVRNMLNN
ncbi:MAG: 1-acyl-sn-glycerol-3-phosphate acyltransferase [Bacteroidaceae bacterium]|nr:1-acyl-sn-glycerol-3-phosphate acyltransferase [Bacteroidaceae bacterium]